MAESTYTYSTTSTFTSKVPAAVGNMAFAATSDSIYVYTKDSYTTVALPDAIHSNVTQVVYLYDLDTVVAINNKGIVSLNTNTLEFNISSLNSGNSPSIIHECAYDTINKRIICACGDVYTVDTSNTALPLIDTNGFTYIKAK